MPYGNVASVMSVFQAGNQFDPTLVPRLANAQAEVGNVVSSLETAGMSALAGALSGFDPSNAMAQLTSFVQNTALPNLFNDLDVFSSVASIVSADEASLATAFGSLFTARSFIGAIDDILATLAALADDSTDTEPSDPAIDPVVAATDNITARVSQLAALPDQIPNIITEETSFYANSTQTLSAYSQSLQALQVFDDFNFKAVLGAVASDELLGAIKPSDAVATPPPLPPPPPPPPYAPPNQDADPTPQ